MTRDEFVQKLREGVVVFSYRKKGGEIRKARGTLKMDLIPESQHPQGAEKAAGAGGALPRTQGYYDLDKNNWRSFTWEKLESVM